MTGGEIFVRLLCACLGSSGLTAAVLAALQRHWTRTDRRDDRMDAVVTGLKVLTVDRVRYLGKCYIANRSVSLEDKENLKEMHRAYRALGGNGHLNTIMDEVERLPVTSE